MEQYNPLFIAFQQGYARRNSNNFSRDWDEFKTNHADLFQPPSLAKPSVNGELLGFLEIEIEKANKNGKACNLKDGDFNMALAWYSAAEAFSIVKNKITELLNTPHGHQSSIINCPSCNTVWDLSRHNGCQCGATLVTKASPAKAEQEGPWVKASDRLPEIADGVTKLKIDGKEAEGVWSATEQAFIVGGHRYPPTLYYIEWLDEKKRREQEGLRWIDCKNELPKESGRYWCYVEEVNDLGISHFQWNCCYSANDDRWSDNLQTMNVTHWMPLPKAPSESATLPVKVVEHMGLSWIDANAYPPPEEGYYFALPMSIAYYHADKKKWDRTITHYGKKQSTPPVKEDRKWYSNWELRMEQEPVKEAGQPAGEIDIAKYTLWVFTEVVGWDKADHTFRLHGEIEHRPISDLYPKYLESQNNKP